MKKPSNKPSFDLEFLGEHGRLSIGDARQFHSLMMRKHGITDPDEIIADWNRRDPDAPWDSGRAGRYVQELTELVCAFMREKIRDAGGPDVEVEL